MRGGDDLTVVGGKAVGRLIVFEGPDGVGKSTLAREVGRVLAETGRSVEVMSFPGNEPGTLGKLVYDVHHEPERFGVGAPSQAARQALHLAAHLDALETKILPKLAQGVWVVLDRFWWSLGVDGTVSGVAPPVLQSLLAVETAAWGTCRPSVVFLVRREAPIKRDEPLPFWLRLREEYDRIANLEARQHPVTVVENDRELVRAVEAVMATIDELEQPRVVGNATSRRGGEQLEIGFTPAKARPHEPRATRARVSHIAPLKPSPVYDTYWRFAVERQEIFFKRFCGTPPPWTDDAILSTYKFTNAYRASDRVSQYLIRRVIYRDDLPQNPVEVFFRILLFKVFNKIETWELLEEEIGPVTFEDYSFKRYDAVLTKAMAVGTSIYSAAYIMPSAGSLGHEKKHRNHLALIERMIRDHVPSKLTDVKSMQRGFEILRGYPTIGDFLGYQYITDVNYSEITDFKETEFVIPGPGALDGIRKCFEDRGGLAEAEVIRFVADRQEREFERLGISFRSLWGRRLQLIDCQNLFCEVDKYARVHHPEVVGLSGRTRIKQRFSAHLKPLELWYPPKWRINDMIASRRLPPPAEAARVQ